MPTTGNVRISTFQQQRCSNNLFQQQGMLEYNIGTITVTVTFDVIVGTQTVKI